MYIYLTSGGSQIFFSDNNASSFRIRLSRPIILYGEWEIALEQVSIPQLDKNYKPVYIDICSSACQPSILNHAEKQVLNRIFLSEIGNSGCIRLLAPHYLRVNTNNLYVIDINLFDDKGEQPSFGEGEVYCTLHLRRCLK